MNLRIGRLARNDLLSIGEWIAKGNPKRAAEYVVEIEQACRKLVDFPETGQVIGRYKQEAIRRKVHDNYLVLYVRRKDEIFIVRVINGAQDYVRFLD